MKIQKIVVATCLMVAGSVSAQTKNAYFELSYQKIDIDAKSNVAAIRGIYGTRMTSWLDLEAMLGVGIEDAEADRLVVNGISVTPRAEVDRYVGFYAKPKLLLGGVELFGRVGYASVQSTFKGSGVSGNQTSFYEQTVVEKGVSYGFGASYALSQSFAISADYMEIGKDSKTMSTGIRYKF